MEVNGTAEFLSSVLNQAHSRPGSAQNIFIIHSSSQQGLHSLSAYFGVFKFSSFAGKLVFLSAARGKKKPGVCFILKIRIPASLSWCCFCQKQPWIRFLLRRKERRGATLPERALARRRGPGSAEHLWPPKLSDASGIWRMEAEDPRETTCAAFPAASAGWMKGMAARRRSAARRTPVLKLLRRLWRDKKGLFLLEFHI